MVERLLKLAVAVLFISMLAYLGYRLVAKIVDYLIRIF